MDKPFHGLYALPPGVDFAREFASGFLQRMQGQPPEAIARVTIYANASRTLTELKAAFDEQGPMLLPQMRPVTNLDLPEMRGTALAAPLARRLRLARLVAHLLQTRPDLAAGHSVPMLARSLTALMTEMQTEGRDLAALEAIDTGDHARHWENALAFLRIAAGYHLEAPMVDRAARQRAAAQQYLDDWARGLNLPDGPVIVAGSTGSHGATRMFMQAVTSLPNGAVVLPGFDFHQPQDVWDRLDERADDHPQARFAPLIRASGYPSRWTDTAPASDARNALLSLALRPAPVTDQWIADGPNLPDLIAPTQNVTLIEADQPGQEAEAVALLMRDAAERQERATLITADGNLTRRVTAALDRWHLRPDESAGQPLSLSAPGLFLRQVAALFGQALTIDRLLILLKHPVAMSGSATLPANEARRLTRDLELRLRKRGPAFPDGAALRDWADKGDALHKEWADWLAAMLDRIKLIEGDHALRPLSDRLGDLRDLAQGLAAGPGGDADASRLWQSRAGQLARAAMDHLASHAAEGPEMGPGDFSALLLDEFQQHMVRTEGEAHPLLHIRGPREARIIGSGTVILAGLNEGGWPRALEPDPWLSRQMRLDAGLTVPERQIGLSAHDFQQAIGLPRVFLTRARRDAEAETIPSRWLNRLMNLMNGLPQRNGPQALAAMRGRGDDWLAMAQALAQPTEALPAAPRPSPIPPGPPFRELPVTDVSLLIRDPYAVYAKRVLGLRPLNPLRPEPDAALRGQTLHAIVEELLTSKPDPDSSPDDLKAAFLRVTAKVLQAEVPWPAARTFWQARMEKIADQIVTDELARMQQGEPVVVERRGRVHIRDLDFTLTAKPDRIDQLRDGQVMIYDYKSGAPPSDAQISHFDKQLVLEAAMARQGGFDALGPADVAGIRYIQLGGEGKTHPRDYSAQMEQDNWQGFLRLIASYLTGGAGFTAKRAPEKTAYAGDYDHLSRYGEWSLSDPARPEKVGRDG
ncbi:double-strand break repair protein AddB [Paracoccus fistulariae]|uniref:Double-strand break repair protein AddB n=1 Tax=Paracoccus fistulariae TaxID=658446 RepID=A0ABY7SGQ7_9RHOB|nr:double-strand break repair protein AddB [Paracoccus fistulariae]MDB6180899.1 double-strand break repair protein AddB [Paracoccus fistulariae]WCR06197.1 double-strand break repair protein AddB [Paracoccus fistulariae]